MPPTVISYPYRRPGQQSQPSYSQCQPWQVGGPSSAQEAGHGVHQRPHAGVSDALKAPGSVAAASLAVPRMGNEQHRAMDMDPELDDYDNI
jgi:hypothetical protein